MAFQIWRRSMRSISPWLLLRCPSVAWEPTPRPRQNLVDFRSPLSMAGWNAAIISVPTNSTRCVYLALIPLLLKSLLLVLVIGFFSGDASLEAQAPPAPTPQLSGYE